MLAETARTPDTQIAIATPGHETLQDQMKDHNVDNVEVPVCVHLVARFSLHNV